MWETYFRSWIFGWIRWHCLFIDFPLSNYTQSLHTRARNMKGGKVWTRVTVRDLYCHFLFIWSFAMCVCASFSASSFCTNIFLSHDFLTISELFSSFFGCFCALLCVCCHLLSGFRSELWCQQYGWFVNKFTTLKGSFFAVYAGVENKIYVDFEMSLFYFFSIGMESGWFDLYSLFTAYDILSHIGFFGFTLSSVVILHFRRYTFYILHLSLYSTIIFGFVFVL